MAFVYIWFWIFGWLGQQFSPFFPFNMFTWHRYWIGIYPTRVFPCSSLTVAWHSHGWWGRWAWGRRRMINSCFEGVMDVEEGKLKEELVDKPGTTIGTKFSVLQCIRIPFLMRLWFLDRWSTHKSIRVHRKPFPAIKLLAYPRRVSLSRIYPILWHKSGLFMRLHFSIGCYDCRRTSQRRQSIHFSSFEVLFFWSCASKIRSLQQFLVPQVWDLMQAGTNFPKARRMLLYFSSLILGCF